MLLFTHVCSMHMHPAYANGVVCSAGPVASRPCETVQQPSTQTQGMNKQPTYSGCGKRPLRCALAGKKERGRRHVVKLAVGTAWGQQAGVLPVWSA